LATRDGGSQELAYGWSNREAREPVNTGHLFQTGSITKSFVARRSRLWMQSSWEGPVPLLAAGPNTYRIGDPQTPDVVRFEGFADGQPQVLSIWGVSVMRASV